MKPTEYQNRIFSRNFKIIEALKQGQAPKLVASSFGISEAMVYNIRKKDEKGGITALMPKSKAPKTKPTWNSQIIQLILKVRQDTGYGAEKIYDYLVAQAPTLGIETSQIPKARMMHNILKEHGQIAKIPSKKKIHKPDYYHTRTKTHPNDILEVDMKTDHFLESRPVIVNGTIDICSKVVSVSIADSQSTENAILNLVEHVYQWGLVNKIKTDNDMAYIGQVEGSSFGLFTKVCLLLGIEQIFIPVHRPRWNAHIERFFRTWDDDFFKRIYHHGWDALIQGSRGFTQRYLTERSHQGLKKLLNNSEKIKFPQQYHQKYADIKLPNINKEDLIELIKNKDIPLAEGNVLFIRKVPETCIVKFKQNQFVIPKSFVGMMIQATIFVQTNRKQFDVDIYFRDHKITSAKYMIKQYKKGRN